MFEMPKINGLVEEKKDLKPISWFKTGGKADFFYTPSSIVDLQEFMKKVSSEIPVYIIGNLSNVLIRDDGIKGIVIKLKNEKFKFVDVKEGLVEVGAGALNRNLCLKACEKGQAGLEFLNAIPGTVGGAIKMNAGAYGKEVKDIFISCRIMDMQGNIRVVTADEIYFSYRKSSIKDEEIILSAIFKTEHSTPEEITNIMLDMAESRKNSQPIRAKTGGSTFKNPESCSAWKLIDEAGLRGHVIGGAKISEQHTNFIVNFDNAKSKDIEDLINLAKEKVLQNSGIELQTEIKILGE
ncbi:MAG: UDP-N-acetylmuramate dehydrogenase [Alphaproteobacteria bacterium]|nr:UDP-N-acetylmuramate dehydrogenase [Alphaproteobacteria bacterium]